MRKPCLRLFCVRRGANISSWEGTRAGIRRYDVVSGVRFWLLRGSASTREWQHSHSIGLGYVEGAKELNAEVVNVVRYRPWRELEDAN